MKVVMKEAAKYSSNGVNCIKLCAGEVVELPGDIEAAWLSRGLCEVEKDKSTDNSAWHPGDIENKIVAPVEEKKEEPKKKVKTKKDK